MNKGRFGQLYADGAVFSFEVEQAEDMRVSRGPKGPKESRSAEKP